MLLTGRNSPHRLAAPHWESSLARVPHTSLRRRTGAQSAAAELRDKGAPAAGCASWGQGLMWLGLTRGKTRRGRIETHRSAEMLGAHRPALFTAVSPDPGSPRPGQLASGGHDPRAIPVDRWALWRGPAGGPGGGGGGKCAVRSRIAAVSDRRSEPGPGAPSLVVGLARTGGRRLCGRGLQVKA